MDRQWHEGDLVQTGDEWHVLTAERPCDDSRRVLLAAADAPLWEALRGLPGCEEHAPGYQAIAPQNKDYYLSLQRFEGKIDAVLGDNAGGDAMWRAEDIPALEQAIQRFKAVQAYIAAHKGGSDG